MKSPSVVERAEEHSQIGLSRQKSMHSKDSDAYLERVEICGRADSF